MSLKIERAPLELLQEVLPRLLSRLSIGRAQIALEHLRSNLQNRPHEEILFYLAQEQNASEPLDSGQNEASESIAALIAIQQPCIDEASSSDVATIVHADFLIDHAGDIENSVANNAQQNDTAAIASAPAAHRLMQSDDQHQVIMQMRKHVESDLLDRGVRFVQWATDATTQSGLSAHQRQEGQWHEGLGFQKIATLDYLTGTLNSTGEADTNSSAPPNDSEDHETRIAIDLRPLDWDAEESRLSFNQLVEATYSGTLDCPALAHYRTTSETLRGYQTSASFAPDLWFEVFDTNGSDNTPIGCMILAKHDESQEKTETSDANRDTAEAVSSRTAETESNRNPAHSPEGPVLEIVYMGLIPETRGKGLGRRLVEQAAKVAVSLGGTRFILGVDQTNRPARDIYTAQGMTPLLSETVWVKRVESEKPRPA